MPDNLKIAIAIATKSHQGQFRRDGVTPYITHPEAVANAFPTKCEGLKAVAWLHDVLEDTNTTEEDLLQAGISLWVVQAVQYLTKTPGEDYLAYLARVKASGIAADVKVQDILHNLGDDPSPKQVKKYAIALKFLLAP